MAGMIGGMYGGPQGIGDVLSIIGASLKDASPGSQGTALENARNLIAQRGMMHAQMQAMGQLNGLFGGQRSYQDGPAPALATPGPVGGPQSPIEDPAAAVAQSAGAMAPGPAPAAPAPYTYQPPQVTSTGQASLSDPNTQRTLAQAAMFMPDQSKFILDLLDKAQPHIANINGFAINDKDGSNVGRYFPTLDKGQAPTFGPGGAVSGVQNLPGAVQSAADMAGAVSGATEQGKAAYDLVDVPQSDGTSRKVPRLQAVQMLLGQIPQVAQRGGGPGGAGGASAGGPQFGVSQSPAEVELAKARAATQGKNETDISGARAAMQQVDDQTNMIAQNLHDMLGETQDPNTGKWVKTKPSMVSGLSTGSQTDLIEHVPFLNQSAKDLAAKIETVRNGTSFNSLQAIKNALAAAGDGGSGSIRMTDQTARMLGEINGSLNQDQSGPQFEATVRRHLSQLDALNKARHDLFESQFRGIRPTTPGQTRPTANYNNSSPRVPQPGAVVKGYKFLGGNPADPKSWARAQ